MSETGSGVPLAASVGGANGQPAAADVPLAMVPRADLMAPILAVPRPAHGEIALFVPAPGGTACCVVALDEARALHATLGQALALMDRTSPVLAANGQPREGELLPEDAA